MMKRRKPITHSEASSPELKVAPLIDVCFLLLIYFLATSTILPRESDLDMSLAGTPPPAPFASKIDPLFILESAVELDTRRFPNHGVTD